MEIGDLKGMGYVCGSIMGAKAALLKFVDQPWNITKEAGYSAQLYFLLVLTFL